MKLIFLFLFFTFNILARFWGYTRGDQDSQIMEGNLALPTSQRPGPLFSFGQKNADRSDLLFFPFGFSLRGKNLARTEADLRFLYGIEDFLTLLVGLPIEKDKINNKSSAGAGDIFAQFEYSLYRHYLEYATKRITLVLNMALPTGSSHKNPPLGFGGPSFFIGNTISHLSLEWYAFISAGAKITTKHHDTKFGDQFLYQCGLGHIVFNLPGWIFTLILEFDGIYLKQDKIKNIINPNSGSNTLFLGPQLWISSQHFIFQGGVQYVVMEHLCGNQNRSKYIAAAAAVYKF